MKTMPVPNCPPYRVDIYGNVYGHRGKMTHDLNDRYPRLKLMIDGKPVLKYVHHIVLETFIGPRPESMECCHRNGNALDNRLGNLRWGTRESNARDKIRHGTTTRGERNHHAKLTSNQVEQIRQLRRDGLNNKQIAKRFGVTHSNVSAICLGKSWK